MHTNFFTAITAMMADDSRLVFTVIKDNAGTLLLTVAYDMANERKNNQPLIHPLVFRKATAEELDAQFLQRITEPVQQISDLLINERQLKASIQQNKDRQATKPAQPSTPATAPVKRLPPKYEAAMKKVDELEKKGLYRQAVAALPPVKSFPTFKAEIEERAAQLKKAYQDQPEGMFAGGGENKITHSTKPPQNDDNTFPSTDDHIPAGAATGYDPGDHTDDHSDHDFDPDDLDYDNGNPDSVESNFDTTGHQSFMNH